MKRKLNPENIPTLATTSDEPLSEGRAFDEFGLDYRLLQAVGGENFKTATPIQAQAIPLALEGRDILGTANWVLHQTEMANSTSSSKDRFGQNSSLRPTCSGKNIAQKGRKFHLWA